MELLLQYVGGVAGVTILGTVKKFTGIADTKIFALVKPIQPLIALGITLGLPYAAHALHLTTTVDPAQVAAAPTATILGIVAAEVLSRLTKKNV